MANNAFAFILSGIRQGMSANRVLAELQAAGLGVRRQVGLDLVREARTSIAANAAIGEFLPNIIPSGADILPMSTKTATGYLQHIDIYVVDRETGAIGVRPYSIATDTLLTHGDAVDAALDQMTANQHNYSERVVGAVYRSTYQMIPGVLA